MTFSSSFLVALFVLAPAALSFTPVAPRRSAFVSRSAHFRTVTR
jgi:hypothetical protein